MIVCATCEKNTDTLICEECGALFCMDCYRRYEWQEMSRLCWVCQAEADQEWMGEVLSAARGAAGLPRPTRRTWPRKQPPICPACDGGGTDVLFRPCKTCGGAGIVAPS